MKNKVLYVKNSSSKINFNTYNIQAIGLGKAFCTLGFDFDFLFFSKEEKVLSEEIVNNHTLRIISKKGIRVLRSYICKEILDENFLNMYDFVISTEYGQYMTYALSKISDNIVMYSGPYYNLFKIPFVSQIYDLLFTKKINQNIRHKFVKSILAKEFLEAKGYTNVVNIGVALDIERFDAKIDMQSETEKVVSFMKKNRCLLYVGALSNRKNYPFILEVYKKVLADNPDVKFVMIGNGNKKYINKYMNRLSEKERSGIYRLEQIDNSQLKFIYPLAKAFLLPSKLEIFGMVLLEAMYLGAPVVTSWNGGSSTLISGRGTGLIVKKFDVSEWKKEIQKYLDDEKYTLVVTQSAKKLIKEEFTWDVLAKKMLKTILEK